MNFKKLFLLFFTLNNILSITASQDLEQKEIVEYLEQNHRYIVHRNSQGRYAFPVTNVKHQQILFLIELDKQAKEEKERIIAAKTLKYICSQEPTLMYEMIDWAIKEKRYDYIEHFINTGLNPKIEDKEYTIKEILEAHFGSRNINEIKSKNCDGWKSKIFGQSYECKQIKKSLESLEK